MTGLKQSNRKYIPHRVWNLRRSPYTYTRHVLGTIFALQPVRYYDQYVVMRCKLQFRQDAIFGKRREVLPLCGVLLTHSPHHFRTVVSKGWMNTLRHGRVRESQHSFSLLKQLHFKHKPGSFREKQHSFTLPWQLHLEDIPCFSDQFINPNITTTLSLPTTFLPPPALTTKMCGAIIL